MTTITTTPQQRWGDAIHTLKSRGVAVRQNVRSCCPGCAEPFKRTRNFNSEVTPYAWTFGGQGNALRWVDGEGLTDSQLHRSKANLEPTVIYFNHGNGAGELIADAFLTAGFDVEWNGTDAQCVMVTV